MTTFEIDTKALAGALIAASKNDVRYYLNGVHVDFDARVVVATDGHILVAFGNAVRPVADEAYPTGTVIMPRGHVTAMLKAAGKRTTSIVMTIDGAQVGHRMGGAQTTFAAIDGKFPDWRRVVPMRCSLEPAQYDPQLLARLQDAMGAKFVGLHMNGTGAGVMTCSDPDVLGVCMGWRADAPEHLPGALKVAHGDKFEAAAA